jgi:hypothetical protein
MMLRRIRKSNKSSSTAAERQSNEPVLPLNSINTPPIHDDYLSASRSDVCGMLLPIVNEVGHQSSAVLPTETTYHILCDMPLLF